MPNKSLQKEKNSPEGRSILRSAYRSYYFWKRVLEIEGIGIERDLAGMPVMGIPSACFLSDATPEQKATLAAAKDIVTSLHRHELEGAVIPLEYTPERRTRCTTSLSSPRRGEGSSTPRPSSPSVTGRSCSA